MLVKADWVASELGTESDALEVGLGALLLLCDVGIRRAFREQVQEGEVRDPESIQTRRVPSVGPARGRKLNRARRASSPVDAFEVDVLRVVQVQIQISTERLLSREQARDGCTGRAYEIRRQLRRTRREGRRGKGSRASSAGLDSRSTASSSSLVSSGPSTSVLISDSTALESTSGFFLWNSLMDTRRA